MICFIRMLCKGLIFSGFNCVGEKKCVIVSSVCMLGMGVGLVMMGVFLVVIWFSGMLLESVV